MQIRSSNRCKKGFVLLAVLYVCLLLACSSAWAGDAERTVKLHIAAAPLGPALIQFSDQASVQVVSDAVDVSHARSPGVSGTMTVAAGLTRLLAGTGFSFERVDDNTYAVTTAGHATGDAATGATGSQTPSLPSPSSAGPAANRQAQEQPGHTSLEAVVVVASRRPVSISQIPASVYYLDPEDIQARIRGGATLKQVLGALVPAMDVGSQTRTNAYQNLQGREAQVMINGVSLMSSRAIHRQLDSIDPFNIDHIVVLSGASSIYGAGASGGVINIVTKKGSPGPLGATLQVALGTKGKSDIGNRKGAFALHGGNDSVSGRLSFAWNKTDGFYGPDGNQIFYDISQTGLQYNVSKDVMGSLTFDFGGGGTLQLLAQHYSSQRHGGKGLYLGPNLAGLMGYPALLEMRDGLSMDFKPGTSRDLVTADWNAPGLVFGQDLLLQLYYRSANLNFYPFPEFAPVTLAGGFSTQVPFYGASSQDTTVKGLRTALIADLGNDASLTYGVDYAWENFHASETMFDTATAFASGGMTFDKSGKIGKYPGFKTRQLAAFVQGQWQAGPNVQLSAGVRGEHINFDVDDFVGYYQQALIFQGVASSADSIPGGSNDYSALLPNLGVVWSMGGSRQQLYANYSVGFEVPDPAKYYGQGDYLLDGLGGHLLLGNSTNVASSPLKAIKTRQLQLGFRGTVGGFDYDVASFLAKSDKTYNLVPVILKVVEVDDPVRTYGVQGKLSYRFHPDWRIGASGMWVQTDQKSNGHWQDGPVVSSSPSKLVSFLSYAPSSTGLSATLQSTTVFDLEGTGGERLNGFTTWSLLGSWQVRNWRINAGVENLFNHYYQTLWSQRQQIFAGAVLAPAVYFQGMGRRYSVTATVDF